VALQAAGALGVLAGSAAAAACSGAAGGGTGESAGGAAGGMPAGPVTINYLSFFAQDDPQTLLFGHALPLFQQKYPKANVEQTTSSGSGANVMEKYLALLSAGTAPDVAAVNPQFVEPLRARGALADLTDFVKRDAKTFQPEDFNEATLLRAVRAGKWHALPLQMGLWFLFHNVTALSQAGVTKPDGSWTWDKLLEAVTAIKQRDANSLGMSGPPYELPVRGNGGDVLSQDEKKCILDQPVAVEAIQWLGDLRQKNRVVPTGAETGGQATRALFDTGKYAFHIGDPGFLSGTIRGKLAFQWDIAIVPKGKVAHVDTVKGPSLVMSNDSKQKDAAWTWLSFYNGAEMQRWVATEGKIVSARKSALKAFVDLDEGYNKQAILQAASIAKPMPYVARYDEIDKEISTGLSAVNEGQKPAKEAMADVVQKVNALLAG
jgi:multiple sugar transport system substrate-binding protein